MTQSGFLSKIIMSLLIVIVLVIAFSYSLEDYQTKYDFEVSDEFNQSYDYSEEMMDQIEEIKVDTQGGAGEIIGDLYNSAMAIFRLPILAIEYLGGILSGSLRWLGLPEDTAQTIGKLLTFIVTMAILVAFVTTILYAIRNKS